jgi:hypothetical protein
MVKCGVLFEVGTELFKCYLDELRLWRVKCFTIFIIVTGHLSALLLIPDLINDAFCRSDYTASNDNTVSEEKTERNVESSSRVLI